MVLLIEGHPRFDHREHLPEHLITYCHHGHFVAFPLAAEAFVEFFTKLVVALGRAGAQATERSDGVPSFSEVGEPEGAVTQL